MAYELYLTDAEEKLFEALPEELTDGCTVFDEERHFVDCAEDLLARQSLIHFEDIDLLSLQNRLREQSSQEGVVQIMESLNLDALSPHDVREMFFLVGPEYLSRLIETTLLEAKTSEGIEKVAHLSITRASLLNAFVPA